MSRKNRIHGVGSYNFATVNFIDSQFLLASPVLKLAFCLLLLRLVAALGNVLVGFFVQSNHVHLVFFIPPRPGEVSDDELLQASAVIRGENHRDHLAFVDAMSDPARQSGARERALAMRNNLPCMMQALDQRMARLIHDINGSTGRAIDDRYHNAVLSKAAALRAVRYSCLNGVRAGLETVPGQIPFSIYGLAMRGVEGARECIHFLMGGNDAEHSLRLFEISMAEAGSVPVAGKRTLTEAEAQVLIDGRNDCARTHPLDAGARLDGLVCPPPFRPRNGHEPIASDGLSATADGDLDATPSFLEYLERGQFVGERDFVLDQARAHYGSADPRRLVCIDPSADLWCYNKPSMKRLKAERAKALADQARASADLQAQGRQHKEAARQARRANREQKRLQRQSKPAAQQESISASTATGPAESVPPEAGIATCATASSATTSSSRKKPHPSTDPDTPPVANPPGTLNAARTAPPISDNPRRPAGAVTARQVSIWRRARDAFFRGQAYDPRDLPPILALFCPYAWRRGDGPRSDNPMDARSHPLDFPLLRNLPARAA